MESLLKRPPKGQLSNKPKIFKVARSPLLDRIQAFLPEFHESTKELLTQSKQKLESMDIENTEDDSNVVEMNILIGEMDSQSESDEHGSTLLGYGSYSDSDSDSKSEDSAVVGPVTLTNIRIPSEAKGGRKRSKCHIRMVDDMQDEESLCREKSDSEITEASTNSGER